MNIRAKLVVVLASTSLVVLLLVGAVVGRSAPPDEPYKHIAVFTEVVHRIKSEYVEEPDMKSVTLGAVNGLLESVDPFASYLSADQFKDYSKKKDSYKGDVGLVLSKRAGIIGVVGVIPGSPAGLTGLAVGDWLEAIRGVSTRDMPLAYAELMMKGDPGTTIEISVFRTRRPEPQKITLTRAAITYPRVGSQMIGADTGHIRPLALAPGAAAEVAAAVAKLEQQGAKRLVLDLRSCAFGSPEDGIELARLFVDKGLIGYLQGQKVPRQNFESDVAKVKTRAPLEVITNRGTAWGCEVAAAALIESKRAFSVGERTYGAASLRKTLPLDDGGAVILSVAKYYTPAGKSIPDNGVTPQQALPEPDSQIEYDEDGNPLPVDPEALRKSQEEYVGRAVSIWK